APPGPTPWPSRRHARCDSQLDALAPRHRDDILVAAAREIHEERGALRVARRLFNRPRYGVRRLKGRNDAFRLGEAVECRESRIVADGDVARPPELGEARMLGTDRGVVEARGHRVRRKHLPVRALQDERARAMEDADRSRAEAGGVLPRRDAPTSGLDAHHLDLPEGQELAEEAD